METNSKLSNKIKQKLPVDSDVNELEVTDPKY